MGQSNLLLKIVMNCNHFWSVNDDPNKKLTPDVPQFQ